MLPINVPEESRAEAAYSTLAEYIEDDAEFSLSFH